MHYDIDLNKLSSSCSLWQQTSARVYMYGARQQVTGKVLGLGRSQRTDTNNLLAIFWCPCSCQPRDAERFWNLIGVFLATRWSTHGSSVNQDIPSAGYFIPPSGRGTQGLTYTYTICIYLPVDPKIKGFFYVCILYTHHIEVSILFGHGVLTCDQMISGNVLLYPMGNTSPLGNLPGLKSRMDRSL